LVGKNRDIKIAFIERHLSEIREIYEAKVIKEKEY